MSTTKKYLLSTGSSTTKLEEYILDLIRLNLIALPNDVPNNSDIGFNYSLTNITKDLLYNSLTRSINSLILKLKKRFPSATIELDSLSLINEELADISVTINNISDNFSFNIYNNNDTV